VAGLSIAITLGIVFMITRSWKLGTEGFFSFRDILGTLFSLGKRQIKIRKMRSLLTISSLVVLVLAFTSFTSFGWVYGMTKETIPYASTVDGILMKRAENETFVYGQNNYSLFKPLDASYLQMLIQLIPVQQAAPKIETFPTEDPIARIISSQGTSIDIRGVIGVDPVSEAIYTKLNTIIPAGSGVYLNTNDPNGILVSNSAASALNYIPGETIQFLSSEGTVLNCTVKGIFSDSSYSQLADIDGQPFGPKTLVHKSGKVLMTVCNATNVVIMNWQTTINFQKQINIQQGKDEDEIGRYNILSRIAFRVSSGYGIDNVAKTIVNDLYCDIYNSENSKV
jgi:hypothetical protein